MKDFIPSNVPMDFDKGFEPLPREYRASQELFYIYSHSRVLDG